MIDYIKSRINEISLCQLIVILFDGALAKYHICINENLQRKSDNIPTSYQYQRFTVWVTISVLLRCDLTYKFSHEKPSYKIGILTCMITIIDL